MRWLLLLLVLLSGCRNFALDEKWKPLKNVQECPLVIMEAKAVTIGETLYVKNYDNWKNSDENTLNAHLAHEQVHAIRQKSGIISWLWKYFTDKEFMKYEEQLGYYTQIKYLQDRNEKSKLEKLKDYDLYILYENLDGPMFKDKEEFEQWFDDVINGKWKPN